MHAVQLGIDGDLDAEDLWKAPSLVTTVADANLFIAHDRYFNGKVPSSW